MFMYFYKAKTKTTEIKETKDAHTLALYFSSSETTVNRSSLPGLVTTYVTTCNVKQEHEHTHEYTEV